MNGTYQTEPDSQDQLPPHSIDAEAGVLGNLLLDSTDKAQMLGELQESDFYDLRHQKIFRAIVQLASDGEDLCPHTVQRRLIAGGILDSCGGTGYVSALPDGKAPFEVYLNTVRADSAKRDLLKLSVQFEHAARNGTDPKDAYLFLESAFLSLGQRRGFSDLPAIVSASELVSRNHVRPVEIVEGLLHQGSKLVLGGGSKSCKTWCLADLALSVSHGKPWLALETVQRNALFLNFEIQEEFFADRLRMIASAKGITLKPVLDVWNLRGRSADAATLFPKIKARIKGRDYGLVVLDPIYKLYGATDENSAGDVARLLNQIEDLAVSTGAAVAFGAHFSKGNQAAKEAIDRVSGSGVFARDPDSLLMLTALKERNCYAVETVLRNFAPLEPFAVRFEFPLMVRDDQLDPADLKQPGGRKKEFSDSEVLDLLATESLTTGEWAKVAKSELGISEPTFYRARSGLEKAGRIIKSKVNGKWAILTRKAAA